MLRRSHEPQLHATRGKIKTKEKYARLTQNGTRRNQVLTYQHSLTTQGTNCVE